MAQRGFSDTFLCPPTLFTVLCYGSYYAYICLASIFLKGPNVPGHPHPKRGPQLTYTINGFKTALLTAGAIFLFGGFFPQITIFHISHLSLEFWALWSTVNLFAFLFGVFLYMKARFGWSILGEKTDSFSHGNIALDFWVGRELNPKIGQFDLKFNAYRVSMIFWLVLNLSFLARQSEAGEVKNGMVTYQLLSGFYVMDYFWNEEKMLTTWDIISEEFGYMLVFGDYVFIPFAFSIQCHYLLDDSDAGYGVLLLSVVIFIVGYYLFRQSNSQKNQFKTDPHLSIWGRKPQTILGSNLLISGFWGIARHMNYTGDLLMAFAFCLPCGLQLGAYTYFMYLLTLLVHRATRDDRKCQKKYGQKWKEYQLRVKHVFLPFAPLDTFLVNLGEFLHGLTACI